VNGRDATWDIYSEVLRRVREQDIRFAVGGGMAVGTYVPARLSTKDIDLYVKPTDRHTVIQILEDCGLRDYYEKSPYERHWIHRRYEGEAIVDVMWGMPNRRAYVDDGWLTRGPEIELNGERMRVLPPEELIWAKLYVLQRDRSDWPDILNIMQVTAPTLNWDHLIDRVGADAPLLEALVSVFRWLSPATAAMIPPSARRRLKEARKSTASGIPHDDLLDTRPWFLPRLEQERKAC